MSSTRASALLPFTRQPKGAYLAFLGRISPEKRPDRAIEIAVRAGLPLKIAAEDRQRRPRLLEESTIEPMVASHPNVSNMGEIGDRQKERVSRQCAALLFPIGGPSPSAW